MYAERTYFLIYSNFTKIYGTVFSEQKIPNIYKIYTTISVNFSILFHFVLQINYQIFKNFDRRKSTILKKNHENTSILKMLCVRATEIFGNMFTFS